jgi:hypothetical protein
MPSNYTKRVGFYVNLGASTVKPNISLGGLTTMTNFYFYGFKSCMHKNKAYNISVRIYTNYIWGLWKFTIKKKFVANPKIPFEIFFFLDCKCQSSCSSIALF